MVVQSSSGSTVLTWEVLRAAGPIALRVRPFMSGRDYHSMHHDNGAFRFEPASPGGGSVENDGRSGIVCFAPYPGVPQIEFRTNGEYRHSPDWLSNFLSRAEQDRGLDDTEDLATPGEFVWQLSGPGAEAVCVLRAADRRDTRVRASELRCVGGGRTAPR